MEKIVYKFKPFINNSFNETLEALVQYLKYKYNPINIEYSNNKINPDGCEVGNLIGNFRKPTFIKTKLVFVSKDVQLVSGYGQNYCIFYLSDKQKMYVFWDTNYNEYNDVIEFTHIMARKYKLEKLNEKG